MDLVSVAHISTAIDNIKSTISNALNTWSKGDSGEVDCAQVDCAQVDCAQVDCAELVGNVLEKLSDVQDALFFLRNEVSRLQTENSSLNARLSELQSWEQKIASYNLVETRGGCFVYRSVSEPYHYICPACACGEKIQILQKQNSSAGEYHCPGCERGFFITRPQGEQNG